MLANDLYEEIIRLPVIDVHTHLNRDHLAARDLDTIVSYHMLHYPMRAAGYDRHWPWFGHGPEGDRSEQHNRFFEFWPQVATTEFGTVLRRILKDLYDFDRPLTREQLPRLQSAFEEKNSGPGWAEQVLDRCRIVRLLSSASRKAAPSPGQYDGVRSAVERAPTSGFDETVPWRERFEKIGACVGQEVRCLADLRESVRAFYDQLDWSGGKPFVNWISSQADFSPVPEVQVDRLIDKALRDCWLPPQEHCVLEAAYVRCICLAIRGRTSVFQLVYGIQKPVPEPMRPVARAAPQFASSLGYLFAEFPDIHFNVLNGFEPQEPTWCSLCTAFDNVSLAGFWFHTFYSSVMRAAWRRRLEMVPAARLMGFFSDGYCVEWVYGKLRTVQWILAQVLAERIEQGVCPKNDAIGIAQELLFETPRKIFLPQESIAAEL